ncbi:MAG TPA: hypothetical protein VF811_13210 [Parasulfuritortus sp.]
MMLTYLLAIGLIMVFLLIYVTVQRLYILFRQRNPELGPFRDEHSGCGCCSGGCESGDGSSCSSSH